MDGLRIAEPNETHATANWLLARGFSIIPIEHGGKKAIAKWAAFQKARPTSSDLDAWFGNGHKRNLGIVTGKISGVVVIDCDSEQAIAWASANLPPTPMATRTSKGLHLFYRHPGGTIKNTARIKTPDPKVAIDVRADGGYVVGPTSTHQSGEKYQRIGTWPSVVELPVFDPKWLDTTPAKATRPIRQANGPNDRARILRRARAYLKATPPAVQGAGGDAHTFQVACRLVRGFDLTDVEAIELLADWNSRCVPPWSDVELVAKIEGARTYGDEPIGGRADQPRAHATTTERPIVTVGPSPEDRLTEAGAAERLARLHGDDLRFDHRRGRWLIWQGHRWVPDADAAVTRLALDFARTWQREAVEIADPERRATVFKTALRLERRDALVSLLSLAEAIKPLADLGDQWDTDPVLIGTPSGVVDLRTGTLRPGRREDRITMSTAVAFDPHATCPRWQTFIAEIFRDHADLAGFVHRAIGYSLTGDTSEQCLFCCYGHGSNGKGTLMQTLSRVLGDYAYAMPFSVIELHQRSAIPNDLAALVSRRFVTASETNDGTRLNEARVKALTGCDPVTARFLRAEFFTFEPVGKYWLAVNHRPVVKDDSHAFWRRIRLVPFDRTFAINNALGTELQAEAPGILAWAVAGALAWRTQGLNPPATVIAATREYAHDSDALAGFLADAIDVTDPDSQLLASEFFDSYRKWADRHGLTERERLSATAFGRKASERFRHEHKRAGRTYFGVARRAL